MSEWSCEAQLEPLAGGHRNTAYRTIGLTRDLVFKSTRRSPDALAWLTDVQDAAEAAGFEVPRLQPSRCGLLSEQGWTCEPFLSGIPMEPEDMKSLHPQIEAFHAATSDLPQRPGFLGISDLLTRDKAGDIDFRTMPPPLVADIREAWHAAAEDRTCVIHGDLNPTNILRRPSGTIALIDWDECRKDAAFFDLAQIDIASPTQRRAIQGWEIAVCWRLEPARARKLAQTF